MRSSAGTETFAMRIFPLARTLGSPATTVMKRVASEPSAAVLSLVARFNLLFIAISRQRKQEHSLDDLRRGIIVVHSLHAVTPADPQCDRWRELSRTWADRSSRLVRRRHLGFKNSIDASMAAQNLRARSERKRIVNISTLARGGRLPASQTALRSPDVICQTRTP